MFFLGRGLHDELSRIINIDEPNQKSNIFLFQAANLYIFQRIQKRDDPLSSVIPPYRLTGFLSIIKACGMQTRTVNSIFSSAFSMILFLAASPLFSQANPPDGTTCIIDTAMVFNRADTSRYTFIYNKDGKRTQQIIQTLAGENWINFKLYLYTLDAKGNPISDLLHDWREGEWVRYNRRTRAFDACGRVLSDLDERCTDGLWVNYCRHSHTYDTNGNELVYHFGNWKEGNGRVLSAKPVRIMQPDSCSPWFMKMA